jgi:transcriptional regulator with XRE-family HTH domain
MFFPPRYQVIPQQRDAPRKTVSGVTDEAASTCGIRSDTIRFAMRTDLERAAEALREARLATGLTLRMAAGVARTSHATLAAYEAGRKSPTLATFARILRAYGFAADLDLSPRIRERNGFARGRELEEVLRLAEPFPSRPRKDLPPSPFTAR